MTLAEHWNLIFGKPAPISVLTQIAEKGDGPLAIYHNCPEYLCESCHQQTRYYVQYPGARVICQECNGNL